MNAKTEAPSYNPNEIEAAARAYWTERDAYRVTEDASRK